MRCSRLRLPRSLYERIIAHAEAALPDEAVGLLAGSAHGHVQLQITLPNVLGPKRFLAEPYAQYLALQRIANAGLQPLAVYHSHPAGGVELSSDDVLFASRLPYLQLVIALDRPREPAVDIAAYAVDGATVRRAPLEFVAD